MAKRIRMRANGHRTLPYNVDVIEVERATPKCDFDLYVGSTGKTLGARWADYLNCDDEFVTPENSVSRKIRKGSARPLRMNHELAEGFGPFLTREEAERAEGELAYCLEAAGHAVYSERLRHDPRSIRFKGSS